MRGKKKRAAREKEWKCYSRNSIMHTSRCPACGQLVPKYGECKRCRKL